jgi:hypothetical protein
MHVHGNVVRGREDASRQVLERKGEGDAHAADLIGPKLSDRDPELNYAMLPLGWGRKFDFIYIDGRRRMECAMVATLVSHSGTIVILHDYRRARYQSVRLLFDIIEDGPQFRVMRPSDIVLTRAEAQKVGAGAAIDLPA